MWANASCGVMVQSGGDPTLIGCLIRDHAYTGGKRAICSGCGVFVPPSAAGKAVIDGSCVFARNEGGNVVRV